MPATRWCHFQVMSSCCMCFVYAGEAPGQAPGSSHWQESRTWQPCSVYESVLVCHCFPRTGANWQCGSRKSMLSSVPAFTSLYFLFQVSNLFLPPGLQRLASTGSSYSVLWLAGWEHPFSRVCLGREESCHPAHGSGAAAVWSTLHSDLQGKVYSTLQCVFWYRLRVEWEL